MMLCSVIPNFSFKQVEIGLLHDLEHATSVGAEPVTPDDWEILVRYGFRGNRFC